MRIRNNEVPALLSMTKDTTSFLTQVYLVIKVMAMVHYSKVSIVLCNLAVIIVGSVSTSCLVSTNWSQKSQFRSQRIMGDI